MSLVPIKFFMACYIRTDCVPNDPFPLTPFPVHKPSDGVLLDKQCSPHFLKSDLMYEAFM